jgi:DNA primase
VRPVPDARVSTPLRWDEVADVEPADLRLDTVPDRVAQLGDPSRGRAMIFAGDLSTSNGALS